MAEYHKEIYMLGLYGVEMIGVLMRGIICLRKGRHENQCVTWCCCDIM